MKSKAAVGIAALALLLLATAMFLAVGGAAQAASGSSLPPIGQLLSPDTPTLTKGADAAKAGVLYKPHEVIVQFGQNVSAAAQNHLVAAAGATVSRTVTTSQGGRYLLVTSSTLPAETLLQKFKGAAGVQAVSFNYLRQIDTVPNDPMFAQQWALDNVGGDGYLEDADVDAVDAWNVTKGSTSVVVADLDTGVDYTHPDLAANMWVNPGETANDGIDNDDNGYVDDVYGVDRAAWDSDPMDENGHGTHTAGTIAAVGNNSVGVTGLNWKAKIMALRFLDAGGSGWDFDAITCIYYAIEMKLDHKVNVVAINASWGGSGYDDALKEAIDAAGDAGIVFVAAAGNEANNNDYEPAYPASYDSDNIISVAATDSEDELAGFSNWGADTVDLGAPGVGVLSTAHRWQFYYPGDADTEFFFDTMDGDTTSWTATGTWARTSEAPYSEPYSWSDSPGGNYSSSSSSSITSPVIDLSSAPDGTHLGFLMRCELELSWDKLWVDYSSDAGDTWHSMGYASVDTEGEYYVWNVDVPAAYRTSEFRVRFRLTTDASVVCDGVYIDDVGIGVSPLIRYEELSGTSMATPHVTGAVALLAAQSSSQSAATRISRILASVDPIPSLAATSVGRKCVTGGRLNVAAALATNYIEQTDAKLSFTGTWKSSSNTSYSGGSYKYTNTPGCALMTMFQGTALSLIARTGPDQGYATVLVDDEPYEADLYSSTIQYQQRVFCLTGLEPGLHSVVIEPEYPGSTGGAINVDALMIVGQLVVPAPTITSLEPSSGIGSGGSSVVIHGSGFLKLSGATAVKFGTLNALSYQVDSPSQITAVSPGGSGKVRVKVTAGAGSTPDTTADDFTYLAATRYEQSNKMLLYEGTWSTASSSSYSGGSQATTKEPGASMTATFDGTAVALICTKGSSLGLLRVTLDDEDPVYVNLYNSSTKYKQPVWAADDLADEQHTLVVQCVGGVSKTLVNVDAIDLIGTLVSASGITRYESSEPELHYVGSWSETHGSRYSGGSYQYTGAKGAGVLAAFDGTSVRLLCTTGPTLGIMSITLDDGFTYTVDLYSRTTKYEQVVWSKDDLAEGPHTLYITCAGRRGAGTGVQINIDALDIGGQLVSSAGALFPMNLGLFVR